MSQCFIGKCKNNSFTVSEACKGQHAVILQPGTFHFPFLRFALQFE